MFNSENSGELSHKQIRQVFIELRQHSNASDHGQMMSPQHKAI